MDVYNALMLRDFDMSIEKIVGIHQGEKALDVDAWIVNQVDDLQMKINRLQVHVDRLKELQKAMEQFNKMKGIATASTRFGEYILWSFSDEFKLNEQNVEMLKEMTEHSPFSYIALKVKEEDWKTKEVFRPTLGIGILKRNIDKCGLKVPENAEYTSEIPFIGGYFEKENLFEMTQEDLKPMIDCAKQMNVELTGDMTGRFYLSYSKEGKRVYCYAIGMTYQEKQLT